MRILLVEDDDELAAATLAYLRRKAFAVDLARDLEAADEKLRHLTYDTVLLDLHLPDGDGLSLMPLINALDRKPVTVVLTARDMVSDRIRGLDAGADDYVTKPYDPAELLARLRAIQRRLGGNDEEVVRLGALAIDLAREVVRKRGTAVPLTQKEWAVLRIMAARPDLVHPRERLQQALYGLDSETDSNTVEVFISRLRRKLGRTVIRTLRGQGYRLSADGEVG